MNGSFVNDGVVHREKKMNEWLGSFKEMKKKLSFFKNGQKLPWSFKNHFVKFFSEQTNISKDFEKTNEQFILSNLFKSIFYCMEQNQLENEWNRWKLNDNFENERNQCKVYNFNFDNRKIKQKSNSDLEWHVWTKIRILNNFLIKLI